MPTWPGGPCPECGEFMPPALIHCQACRTLLNEDLDPDSVEIPEFVPLPELDEMVALEPSGVYVICPHCQQELRIHLKYADHRVQCKRCAKPFRLSLGDPELRVRAVFLDCPHCEKELRANTKYLGQDVSCKYCGGILKLGQLAG